VKAWLFIGLCMLVLPAQAATVVVDVNGVRDDRGHVLVALCTRADFLQPHCRWKGKAPAKVGHVTISIQNVPPGRYAAQAFHDENDNGTLDRTFFGLPKEAMGFSNDAPMHLGPPRFDAAAFAVGTDAVQIGFSLHYFGK
jgi:uncharacterized protein (DUF2141 family)